MGIVNITPDSFSHDGRLLNQKTDYTSSAVRLAQRMIRAGADIIDIGGESTRPGTKRISAPEELKRILAAVKILAKTARVPISVDTYKASVAQATLDAGASIINNIKGIESDRALLKMIAHYNAGIVLMHLRGTPRTMQKSIRYGNLIQEIIRELKNSIENCLEIGIKSDKIIIDPGIGFGKTAEHNLEILNRLTKFKILNLPILIGTSRKSFIGKILNKAPQQRLLGTVASTCAGVINGAHIVRVHDVAQTAEVVKVVDAIINEGNLS